jgi:hypothetical protein
MARAGVLTRLCRGAYITSQPNDVSARHRLLVRAVLAELALGRGQPRLRSGTARLAHVGAAPGPRACHIRATVGGSPRRAAVRAHGSAGAGRDRRDRRRTRDDRCPRPWWTSSGQWGSSRRSRWPMRRCASTPPGAGLAAPPCCRGGPNREPCPGRVRRDAPNSTPRSAGPRDGRVCLPPAGSSPSPTVGRRAWGVAQPRRDRAGRAPSPRAPVAGATRGIHGVHGLRVGEATHCR